MEQHPVPRQITTFEFKLIGFMTLKQFLFLVIFAPIGYIIANIVPVPILNVFLGILVGGIGAAFAFIPIMDRPMDVWLKNMFKRLNSPSQYFFHKKNDPVYFLNDLFFTGDPHLAVSHVESKAQLQEYLQTKKDATHVPDNQQRDKQKGHIEDLLKQNLQVPQIQSIPGIGHGHAQPSHQDTDGIMKQPFVSGVIKNRKQIPIPGILVTIKDVNGNQLRLLKTNPYGIFATYSPLTEGDYMFEVGDPNGNYFFDTMNVHINPKEQKPIVFYSKEIL